MPAAAWRSLAGHARIKAETLEKLIVRLVLDRLAEPDARSAILTGDRGSDTSCSLRVATIDADIAAHQAAIDEAEQYARKTGAVHYRHASFQRAEPPPLLP